MGGKTMVVVPIPKSVHENPVAPQPSAGPSCLEFAAASALIAGGVLLLTGQKKAGMVTAASGCAIALADQQGTLKRWWESLPGYIDHVQKILDQVQHTVED